MFTDLHLHTTASDGTASPEELVNLVQQAGVSAFAVTDHDTVASIEVIQSLALQRSLLFIPGIEINTYNNGNEYHILGYHIDWLNPVFNKTLQDIRDGRIARMNKMIKQLQEIGLPITIEDVLSIALGESLCRPHLASLLLQKKIVTSIDDAFKRYLSKGQPGYVSRKTLSPSDAVALIHNAGGVAVLAHPGRIRQQLTPDFLQAINIDGLEILHPDHDHVMVASLKKLAKNMGLFSTGGSDYHGYPSNAVLPENTRTNEIGSQRVPLEWATELISKKGA